jgi:hypothetical protein
MSESSEALEWPASEGRLIGGTVLGGMIGNIVEWYDWTIC